MSRIDLFFGLTIVLTMAVFAILPTGGHAGGNPRLAGIYRMPPANNITQ